VRTAIAVGLVALTLPVAACGGDDETANGAGGVAPVEEEDRADVGEATVRLPVGMEGIWVRELEAAEDVDTPGRVELDARSEGTLAFVLPEGGTPQLNATDLDQTTLTVAEVGDEGFCPPEAGEGTYEVEIEGDVMTVTPEADQCSGRASVFGGDWERVQ
jgi:hypothetical protein